MKKFLALALLALAMLLALASCDMPGNSAPVDVTVNDDGYVVVNGIETKYKVETEDEITVSEDGYVVVNGNKTEHKVHTEPVISVIDGYVAINGIKTEYKVDVVDEITIEDGYVAVNGIKTEYRIDTADVIEVDANGYLVVNGVKTQYKVQTESGNTSDTPKVDEITVDADGYVVVNGNKTEHKVHTEPEISVIDGYIAINGVKTEYEVKIPHVHSYGEWELYNDGEIDCEKKLYHRICSDCNNIEWKDGTYQDHNFTTITTPATCQAGGYDTKTCQNCGKVEVCNETPIADHTFASTYTTDNSFHWFKCQFCSAINGKAEHTLDDNGICTACNMVIGATEGILYSISTDGTYAEVIAYTGTATKVRIAEEYNGLPVKVIYQEAFKNLNITSVVIPDSVTSIGDSAFFGCTSLTSVTIGNSVTSIGYDAFYNCTSLTSVTIPDSVTSIGNTAFQNCASLTSVTIGDSVTSIGHGAFSGCTSLTSVTIGDSVTSIGDSAFSDCTSLTSVTIGDSVTSIGEGAFDGCNSALYTEYELGKYVGNETNPYAVLIEVTNKNMSTYAIHPDTKVIGGYAFADCSRLTSITIPDGVTSIGGSAFSDCTSLTSVTIPDSVKSIGGLAFTYCDSLTSITIPDSVKSIGSYAFDGCTSLTSVTFENPNGWECEDYWDTTRVIAISAYDLSYPATAAQCLKSTYFFYYWFRTE